MASTKIITLYKGDLANWPKAAGKRVTEADMIAAGVVCAAINKRPGGREYLAVAMYLRPTGATQGQVQAACRSGTAVNVYHRCVNANVALAVNVANRSDVKGGRVHKVYALALPSKAVKAVDKPKATNKPTVDKPAPVAPAVTPSAT